MAKKHGVTPEQFTEARFLSDVKSVLRKHLELNNQNEKKLKSIIKRKNKMSENVEKKHIRTI